MTIEYPPSFDGAYLFIEQSTNLADQTWETVDYAQVNLVEGDSISYTAGSEKTLADGTTSSDPVEVPYIITPEYITAVANGEIENEAWTVSSAWNTTKEGISGFFRIIGLSFVDSDRDGVDNVTEYGDGTDPYANDAPVIILPDDDGDPKAVNGSVNSVPGDWNTLPVTAYRTPVYAWEQINCLIRFLTGTQGEFTEESTVSELGAWVESLFDGEWEDPEDGFEYPTVSDGSFYRMERDGFGWNGKEKIYPIALHEYDGSEQFINHLIQASSSDSAGLASLADGTPVMVNTSNPWNEEKLQACLKCMHTILCQFQNSGATGHAQVYEVYNDEYFDAEEIGYNNYFSSYTLRYFNLGYDDYERPENYRLFFLKDLQGDGLGLTTHCGYINLQPEYDWVLRYWNGSIFCMPTHYDKYSIISSMPEDIIPGEMSKMFECTDGEDRWLVGGTVNLADLAYREWGDGYGNYAATHRVGFTIDDCRVLSTATIPFVQYLTMDFDRDGSIGTNDLYRFDETHPYRFWVNEDGNNAEYKEADLEDFFPAMFVPPPDTLNVTFTLSADIQLNYIHTGMTASNTQEYLHDIDLAQTLAGQIQTLDAGDQTPITFSTNEVVLLAAAEINTNAHILVHVLESGSETAVLTNYFSFSSVSDMYRTRNLRAGGISSTNGPANWPDELTNGKDFVFVHGYNVTESAGIDWNNTMFKRLWFSGSNAKYNALLWEGTPDGSWTGLGPYHYHNATIHAFAAAPEFASYLNGLNEPVVVAHSLGNMLTSEAISGDHGLPAYKVKQYYALDAAVALEAYGDVGPDDAMTSDNLFDRMDEGLFSDLIPIIPDFNEYEWQDYPYLAWSSEWYKLFTNNVNDARADLTWRHRFSDIQDKTDVFNFYSSTEEVLRVDEGFVSLVSAASKNYVWQIQEHFKGRLNSNWITGLYDELGGAASEYCGWGFVDREPTEHICSIGMFKFAPRRPRRLHEKLALDNSDRNQELEKLEADPLFRHEPAALFEAGAEAFADGTVADNGSGLDYNTSNATVPVGDVQMTDWLIAKAFPSRTRPMGSSAVGNIGGGWVDANFNMSSTDFLNSSAGFFNGDNHDEWHHSDIKDAPYIYVYKLFDKLTTYSGGN